MPTVAELAAMYGKPPVLNGPIKPSDFKKGALSSPVKSKSSNSATPDWRDLAIQRKKDRLQKKQQEEAETSKAPEINGKVANGRAKILDDKESKENNSNPAFLLRNQDSTSSKPSQNSSTTPLKRNAPRNSSLYPKTSNNQSISSGQDSSFLENGEKQSERRECVSFLHKARTASSTSSYTDSIHSQQSDSNKFAAQESEFPSGDSFVSRNSRDLPSTPANSTLPVSGSNACIDRRRRPLPPFVYQQPPPEKPRKPFNARLPSQSEPAGSNLARKKASQPSASPALPARHPPSITDISGRQSDVAPQLRPMPPVPGGAPLPLPERPPLLLTDLGRPNEQSTQIRTLPALPGDAPPLPPPNEKRKSQTPSFSSPPPSANHEIVEEIPTWDEEDELEEAVYDLTPEDENPAIPPRPPLKGPGLPPVPAMENEDEEIYEVTEQQGINVINQNSSNIQGNNQLSKEDEKKKKEAEKKEKEIRKKFKLPLEGEIQIQSVGTIKTDSKWFEKFTVHAHDLVDVIRTNDNPKGKWLIRTKKGIYGYIDSDNIEMNMDIVRKSMTDLMSTPSVPPSLPPLDNYQAADIIPEDIYDDPTCYAEEDSEEDIYEAV